MEGSYRCEDSRCSDPVVGIGSLMGLMDRMNSDVMAVFACHIEVGSCAGSCSCNYEKYSTLTSIENPPYCAVKGFISLA